MQCACAILSSVACPALLYFSTLHHKRSGHTGTKNVQILAYADDVAIVGRNKNALKDTLVNIKSEARKRGLRINENKTKYMEVTRAASNSDYLHCGKYEFEHVK